MKQVMTLTLSLTVVAACGASPPPSETCDATTCGAERHCSLDGVCVAGACEIDAPLGTFIAAVGRVVHGPFDAMLLVSIPSEHGYLRLYLNAGADGPFASGIHTGTFPIRSNESAGFTGIFIELYKFPPYSFSLPSEEYVRYHPLSGTVEISSYASDGPITVRLTKMSFEEVIPDMSLHQYVPSPTGCTTSIDSATVVAAPASVCHPFAANCASNEGCYDTGDHHFCEPAGTLDIGASCTDADRCIPGAECFDGVCLRLCSNFVQVPCPENQTCEGEFGTHGISACVDP